MIQDLISQLKRKRSKVTAVQQEGQLLHQGEGQCQGAGPRGRAYSQPPSRSSSVRPKMSSCLHDVPRQPSSEQDGVTAKTTLSWMLRGGRKPPLREPPASRPAGRRIHGSGHLTPQQGSRSHGGTSGKARPRPQMVLVGLLGGGGRPRHPSTRRPRLLTSELRGHRRRLKHLNNTNRF